MEVPPEYEDDIEVIDDKYLHKLRNDEKEHIMNIVNSLLEKGNRMNGLDVTFSYNGVDIRIKHHENRVWKNAKSVVYFVAKQYFFLKYFIKI
jgi:hypothetical protein